MNEKSGCRSRSARLQAQADTYGGGGSFVAQFTVASSYGGNSTWGEEKMRVRG